MDEKTKRYIKMFIEEKLSCTAYELLKITKIEDMKDYLIACHTITEKAAEEILQEVTDEILQSIGEEK